MGECFMLGAMLMFIYGIIKLIRAYIKHMGIIIALEDILYWIMAGISMFFLLYKEDAGSIRWFALALVICGMYIYYILVEKLILSTVKNSIKRLLKKIRKKDKIKM